MTVRIRVISQKDRIPVRSNLQSVLANGHTNILVYISYKTVHIMILLKKLKIKGRQAPKPRQHHGSIFPTLTVRQYSKLKLESVAKFCKNLSTAVYDPLWPI